MEALPLPLHCPHQESSAVTSQCSCSTGVGGVGGVGGGVQGQVCLLSREPCYGEGKGAYSPSLAQAPNPAALGPSETQGPALVHPLRAQLTGVGHGRKASGEEGAEVMEAGLSRGSPGAISASPWASAVGPGPSQQWEDSLTAGTSIFQIWLFLFPLLQH